MPSESIRKTYDAGLLLWMIFCGVVGCDRQPAASEPGAITFAEPLAAAAPTRRVPINVLLYKDREGWFSCSEADFSLVDAASQRELIRLLQRREYRLVRSNNTWQLHDKQGKSLWNGQVFSYPILEFHTRSPGILATGQSSMIHYRGTLRCYSQDDGEFAVVNDVDLEGYLAGVLGSEMPNHWPSAALRAQCIAARTYALYNVHIRRSKYLWDIGSTQASQVYGGVTRETDRLRQLVRETRGIVITYGLAGGEKIIPAYYSAICGGHTQNAAPVFGKQLPPLRGCNCDYCRTTAPAGRYRWASVSIDKNQVNSLLMERFAELKPLKKIAAINIVQRSDYGRIEKVELVGVNGKVSRIRGEDLRLAVTTSETPVLSSWFELRDAGDSWRFENGHGWGHGVGLCQYGCQSMADQGFDCIDILQHYYPDSVLLRAY